MLSRVRCALRGRAGPRLSHFRGHGARGVPLRGAWRRHGHPVGTVGGPCSTPPDPAPTSCGASPRVDLSERPGAAAACEPGPGRRPAVPLCGAWRRHGGRVGTVGAPCSTPPDPAPTLCGASLRVDLFERPGAAAACEPGPGRRPAVPLRGAWRRHGGRVGTVGAPCGSRWDTARAAAVVVGGLPSGTDGRNHALGGAMRPARAGGSAAVPLPGAWRARCPTSGGMATP
jgi:hypothetical protein